MSEPRKIKVTKRVDRGQHSMVSEQKGATIGGEARQAELQKIRRELLTLAQRVERLAAT